METNWGALIVELFGEPALEHMDFPRGPVVLVHGDGSTLVLYNALLREKGPMVYVFTEHCGYFEFEKEDLKAYASMSLP